MRLIDDHSHLEIIGRDDCLRLLDTQEVGRIGFVIGRTAEILPVNYVLDGEAVVFATAPGSKLQAAERGPVTFEVDQIDSATRSGWSVVIHGLAQEVTSLDPPALRQRLQGLPLSPWADGDRLHLFRIRPRMVTGRRVGHNTTDPAQHRSR